MNDVLKFGKKLFTASVVGVTIAWSMGLAALVPSVAQAATCPELEPGDLFKASSASAVYYLTADWKRAYFPHEDVFKSWNLNFNDVVTVSGDCLFTYPAATPAGISYRAGSRLIKLTDANAVFAITPGNKIVQIGSESVAAALYGSAWAKVVRDVSPFHWSNYSDTQTTWNESKPHDGMLVKKTGETTVYHVKSGMLHMVDGTVPANASADVRTVSASVFGTLSMGSGSMTVNSLFENPPQGTGTGVPTVSGSLSVSLAADTPAAGFALASAARVPFTKVTFRAGSSDITIDSFKVKRTGFPAVDADFSNINVMDSNGNLLNDSGKTLNSDHEVTFTENIVVPANTSKTYTIVADMAAIATMVGGNVPRLTLLSVVSNAASVSGLPVEGNQMTTNESLTLGTVTLAEGTQVGTPTKQVGAENVNLANLKITNSGSADTEDVRVERIVFYNSGTAADADVSGFELKFNGNVVATGVLSNKYLTFDLSSCLENCVIKKGYDRTFEVYGDLTAGSGRTINLDVQYATHVLVKDLDNSVYLTPTDDATAMTNTVTVSQGKINVTKVNNVPAGNVPGNASNVELGSWNFKVTGEPIDVRTTVFKLVTTGTIVPTGLDSLVLYDAAGKALTGSVDGVGGTSTGYATTTDTFTLQPGDNILTLKGKVDNTAVAGDTITVSIDMGNTTNFIARGVNSNLDITLGTYATPQSTVAANIRTVETSALRVTTLSTPAAQSFSPGTSNVLFAKVSLDASGSSEDLKVSQFIVVDETGATAKTIDLQNIRLWVDKDGDSNNGTGSAVALSEVNNGSDTDAGDDETFTFNLSGDDQILVKAGKSVVVEVRADIAGGATAGTHTFVTDGANEVTATGLTTQSTVVETIDAGPTGQAMTIGTSGGQVEVALASENPVAAQLAAGTTVTLAAFNFLATTTEDVELDYLYLTQNITDTASSSYTDYDQIWFEDASGNEIAGTRMSPTSTKPLINFADNAFVVNVANSSGEVLYLKAKLAAIGAGANGVSQHQLGYKINTAADVVAKGDQTGSAATEFLAATAPTGNTHLNFKAYPRFARVSAGNSGLSNSTEDLYRFTVTAVNGPIALNGFTFDVATTTASLVLGTMYLYDVTDANELQVNETAMVGTYYATGAVFQTVGYNNDWDTSYTPDEITVSTGATRTFVLRANVTGAATGASINTGMAGDSAEVPIAYGSRTATNIDSQTHDDFIWSDKSASGHSVSTADWANGYLVAGLSSSTSTLESISY